MPHATKDPVSPAVAGPLATPYTGSVRSVRPEVSIPWWRETVRAWVPMLGLAALIVFQMVSMQRQIGELRADMQQDIGDLRADMQQEIGDLRTNMQQDIGDLRDDLRSEIGALAERIARLEALVGARPGGDGSRPSR